MGQSRCFERTRGASALRRVGPGGLIPISATLSWETPGRSFHFGSEQKTLHTSPESLWDSSTRLISFNSLIIAFTSSS
jgi:hypothetical protein